MFREQSDTFKYSFVFIDFLVSLLVYIAAFAFRFWVLDPSLNDFRDLDLLTYVYMGLLLAVGQVIVFLSIDLYHPRRIQAFSDEAMSILLGVGLNLLTSLSLLFFLRAPEISRTLVLYFAIGNVLAISLFHSLTRRTLRSMRARGYNRRSVIILGGGQTARRVHRLIQKNPMFGYQVLGFVREADEEIMDWQTELGRLSEVETLFQTCRPNVVISALEAGTNTTLAHILTLCDLYGAELKIIPGFVGLVAANSRVESLEGLPVISIREVPAREGFNRVAKRLFDVILASLFVLAFSPLYLLIAVLVRFSSRGPILFQQERIGLDNKKFFMLKFRTMYVQPPEASSTVWTTKNDPRVTPIGRFLRKSSLDELPQFFNVLRGDMSLVGPRPERPYYVEQFKSEVVQYMRRHAVKAGITGWAQINGLRGDTSIQDRIEADIYYIEHWSLFLDLKILLLTPFKGILDKNAY